MLNKTRISGTMDISRLGAAIARPGMDTRVWVSLAVALGESVVDSKYGVYVDVQLIPSGEKLTARVPADYAGEGFGFYAKIHEKDSVVVACPSGNPANGLVVISRLWSAQDIPPQQAVDDQNEVMLVVEKDKNLRLAVSGSGQVEIDSAGKVIVNCADIRLGDKDPAEYVARTDKVMQDFDDLKTHFDAWEAIITGAVINEPGNGSPSALQAALKTPMQATPYPTPGDVACETTKVK